MIVSWICCLASISSSAASFSAFMWFRSPLVSGLDRGWREQWGAPRQLSIRYIRRGHPARAVKGAVKKRPAHPFRHLWIARAPLHKPPPMLPVLDYADLRAVKRLGVIRAAAHPVAH